jgi:hypothetical protein
MVDKGGQEQWPVRSGAEKGAAFRERIKSVHIESFIL